ncbi:MAG: hypothetical protein IKU80_00770 [Firmicutes bacterium]|nr:hypothetical protein [Bacillota bacterium]
MYYTKDATTESGIALTYEVLEKNTLGDSYAITDKYINTLKVLDEIGIEYGFDAEDVEAIGINVYNYNSYYKDEMFYGETTKAPAVVSDTGDYQLDAEYGESYYDCLIRDEEIIREITEFSKTAYKNKTINGSRLSVDVTFHMKDNNKMVYYTSISFGYEDMPQVFQDIVNSVYNR